jgi:hypothetical protein
MFSQIPEKQMNIVRWLLSCAWLLLIVSLFYDPVSLWLTSPTNDISPLRVDPYGCIKVQAECLPQNAYILGPSLFWGVIIPVIILSLLVFGHELWRRICPLAFMSQISKFLGKQRYLKKIDPETGKSRLELAKVQPNSWLAKNYLYLQFALLFISLLARILFIDAEGIILGGFLLGLILLAVIVGYLYGGKAWCQYFCPMAPVETILSEPRGVLNSIAHQNTQLAISQSMCRITDQNGIERSACMACKSPCLDIDAERDYWQNINQPQRQFITYSYLGLLIGYFVYYYLYSGNWNYYVSGGWARQEAQLASLFAPGFYLFDQAIAIPKIAAAPLTLIVFSLLGYGIGRYAEKQYKSYLLRNNKPATADVVHHRVFSIFTFLAFNCFLILGGLPLIIAATNTPKFIIDIPIFWRYLGYFLLVMTSGIWLNRTWKRTKDIYQQEVISNHLRRQLALFDIELPAHLARTDKYINPIEIYQFLDNQVHATREQQLSIYQGVLQDGVRAGDVSIHDSFHDLQLLRQSLNLRDEDHGLIINELSMETPDLFNPQHHYSREDQWRLQGFREQLQNVTKGKQILSTGESVTGLLDNSQADQSLNKVLMSELKKLRSLRQEYAITPAEEEIVLANLDKDNGLSRKSDILLKQLRDLDQTYQIFDPENLPEQATVLQLLRSVIEKKQKTTASRVLNVLTKMDPQQPLAGAIAQQLNDHAHAVLPNLLTNKITSELSPAIVATLEKKSLKTNRQEVSPEVIVNQLEKLWQEEDDLTKSMSLYVICQLDEVKGKELATQVVNHQNSEPLLKETSQILLQQSEEPEAVKTLNIIEKLLQLLNSDLFNTMQTDNLMELAKVAQVKNYKFSEVVLEQGVTGKELMLLVIGEVQLWISSAQGKTLLGNLFPGQMINELEVLADSRQTTTVIVSQPEARILAINTEVFRKMVVNDPGLAEKVSQHKGEYLQQFIQQNI